MPLGEFKRGFRFLQRCTGYQDSLYSRSFRSAQNLIDVRGMLLFSPIVSRPLGVCEVHRDIWRTIT